MSDNNPSDEPDLHSRQVGLGREATTEVVINAQDADLRVRRTFDRKFAGQDVERTFETGYGSTYLLAARIVDNWGPWNTTAPGLSTYMLNAPVSQEPNLTTFTTTVGESRVQYVLDSDLFANTTKGYVVSGENRSYVSDQSEYVAVFPGAREIPPREAALAIRSGLEGILDDQEAIAQRSGVVSIREQMIARGVELPEQLQAFLPPNMRDLRDLPDGQTVSPSAPARPATPRER